MEFSTINNKFPFQPDCVTGIKFNVVPPRDMAIAKNRPKCWTVAFELLLFHHIRNISIDNSTCEKAGKFALVHCTLHDTLYIFIASFVPDHLVIDTSLRVAWPHVGADLDL